MMWREVFSGTLASKAGMLFSASKQGLCITVTEEVKRKCLHRSCRLTYGVPHTVVYRATLTARDFFLAYFYPSSTFTCIFSKTSPDFFPALALANAGSCVGPQDKIGQPA